MNKRRDGLTANIASSRNWFRTDLLPNETTLYHQSLTTPSTLQSFDGVKLLFIEDGSGTLIANGNSYPLRAGSCCLIYYCHFHKLIPDPGIELKIVTCYMSFNTFLFATIVPGYHLIEIEAVNEPVVVFFSGKRQQRVRQIIASMDNYRSGTDTDLKFALLFEWLCRLCREYRYLLKANNDET